VDKVSNSQREVTSLTNDSAAASSTTSQSNETSRRGRRNRRERHKNSNKLTSDSDIQSTQADQNPQFISQSLVNLADLQSSGRNKSSVNNTSLNVMSSASGKAVSRSSVMDPVKQTSFSLCPPPSSSITGNSLCCIFVNKCVLQELSAVIQQIVQ